MRLPYIIKIPPAPRLPAPRPLHGLNTASAEPAAQGYRSQAKRGGLKTAGAVGDPLPVGGARVRIPPPAPKPRGPGRALIARAPRARGVEASTLAVAAMATVFIALLAVIARVVVFGGLPPARQAVEGGGGIGRRLDELERRQAAEIAGVRDEIRELGDSR